MIKIAHVILKNGKTMTALNTTKRDDFVVHLASIWSWKGVDRIEYSLGGNKVYRPAVVNAWAQRIKNACNS